GSAESVDDQVHVLRGPRSVLVTEELEGALGGGVGANAGSQDGVGGAVHEVQVEVGGNPVPRLGPLQVHDEGAVVGQRVARGRVDAGARVEVVAGGAGEAGQSGWARRGGAVGGCLVRRDVLAANDGVGVSGGREVRGSGGRYVVDRDADRTVLEHGLDEIGDVIDDHAGPMRVAQTADVVGHGRHTTVGRGEGELGPGREV